MLWMLTGIGLNAAGAFVVRVTTVPLYLDVGGTVVAGVCGGIWAVLGIVAGSAALAMTVGSGMDLHSLLPHLVVGLAAWQFPQLLRRGLGDAALLGAIVGLAVALAAGLVSGARGESPSSLGAVGLLAGLLIRVVDTSVVFIAATVLVRVMSQKWPGVLVPPGGHASPGGAVQCESKDLARQ